MGLITSFPGGNGGSEITIDNALSATSENPVQNKVITTELNKKANSSSIPTKLSQLNEDSAHRTATDTEKSTWNGKQDALTAGNGIDITGNVISAGIPIVANQFDKANIYSTTEKIVGCWTDGRPVYQKVIIGTTPSTPNVDEYYSIGITNIKQFIKASVAIRREDGNAPTIFLNHNPNSESSTSFLVAHSSFSSSNPNTFKLNVGNSFISRPFSAILQYTKTTDAANSFKYADENDYSTTEHIVGTWIDGKPLYQKTFSGTLTKSAPYVINVRTEISNLKHLIIKNATSVAPNGKFVAIPGYISKGANYTIDITPDTTTETVTVTVTGSSSTFTVYVTLQYTKTTD